MIWKKREDTTVAVLPGDGKDHGDGDRSLGSFEQQVRQAAEERRFHLHYQPLCSVADDAVVGVEALLRWDSDAGRIAPARFVPVLESSGLIGGVGEWVLGEACAELAAWPRPDGPGLLGVNVSAHQLTAGFANMVLGTVAAGGFPADRLCLELTNPARLDDASVAWMELRQLKACGVRLFIDDFGTAGASIVDLKRFEIDGVKVDASFIKGLTHHQEDHAIVTALIGLAHSLGMLAIAEGVETAAQLDRLKALGCDLAQGFHFGAPGAGDLVGRLFGA
ncbi:MAG TPA: EAL domain-containing protein [Acidimicrobiia bacterium]|nr:EAL domain-containing protein [Acidimicrobiia bacterium]